jgi:hypothetical protein
MKQVSLESTNLEDCISSAQSELILLTSHGQPMAMVVGVKGMDQEQLELGSTAKFWNLVQQRRSEASISRSELEARLSRVDE